MNPESLSVNIETIAHKLVDEKRAGNLTHDDIPELKKLAVMRPKDRAHGDWSSNVAMQLAKKAGVNPRELAALFADALSQIEGISGVEVAGPGFINITLNSASAAAVVEDILNDPQGFGHNTHLAGQTLNLEFVSANPTGPIHIGGVRWAAVGDSMARILEANGATVVREYYFNDHGQQINRFAKSLVAAAHHEPVPVDGYQGAYIQEIAERSIAQAQADGVDILQLPRIDEGANEQGEPLGEGDSPQREAFRKYAVPMMFEEIRTSMRDFRVNFDVWFHENSLYEQGAVDEAIEVLRKSGDIAKAEGCTWFLSTKHGDDKDRVIIKSNGEYAYFAADIAYYWNKRHRQHEPADVAIYMLGADHHGYIGRMMAMCDAFGDEPGRNMQILIGQLVSVSKDGKPVRMSKRAGNIVTIDDLVQAVGVDAARYSLARTDYNTPVDIDLDLLVQHSNDNPVYYVQYAHARACNVHRMAVDATIHEQDYDLSLLDTQEDGIVLAALAQWPSVVLQAGDLRAPHRIARYLEDLAAAYHRWYNLERVVPMPLTGLETSQSSEQVELSRIRKSPEPARAAARYRLNDAVRSILAQGLSLLGVEAPERM